MKENLVYIAVVAGVVLKKNNKYLLVQEKNPRCYKLWNLPAGRVEVGNTIKDTAIKEAKEESGYNVRLIRELSTTHEEGGDVVRHVFEAEIISGKLQYPKDELFDARWFSYEEIKKMKSKNQLRVDWVFDSISIVENRK